MTDRIAFLLDTLKYTPVHLSIYRARYFTLSMKETEKEPLVLRWAKAMVSVMENIPVVILPKELIVGRLSKEGKYGIFYPELDANLFAEQNTSTAFEGMQHSPCSKQDHKEILNEILPYWKGKTVRDTLYPLLPEDTKKIMFADANIINSSYAEHRFILSETSTVRHSLQWVLDYKKVLELGFIGIQNEAEQKLSALEKENTSKAIEDKKVFYQAVILLCKAIKTFAERYAQKATELAKASSDPIEQKEFFAIAKRCRRVPYYPARSFIEAVQAQWFAQLVSRIEQSHGGNISNGRVDQYLYPYYIKDKTENDLTDEEAKEILQSLWLNISQALRLNATPVGNKMYQDYMHWEFTTIGGQLRDGSDATNKLTTLIFDSVIDFPLHYPWLGIRIHKNTPENFLKHVCDTLLSSPKAPVFLNDEEIVPLLMKRGGKQQDALDYCGSGFSEARMINQDTYLTSTTWVNLLAILQMAFYDGASTASNMEKVGLSTGNLKNFDTYDKLWNALLTQLAFFFAKVIEQQDIADDMRRDTLASPYLSSLHDLCMRDGKDICKGGFAELQSSGNIGVVGFSNLVDSLLVIKELVFEQKKYTLSELLAIIQSNFENNEPLRQECLHVAKYGSSDKKTNEIAYQLDEAMIGFCQKHRNRDGKHPILFYVPVAAHLAMGRVTGATPDGRLAGQAFCYGLSPVKHEDFPTPSLVLSALKKSKNENLHARGARVVSLELPAATYQSPKGKEVFHKIIRVWCEQKHWFLQIHFSKNYQYHTYSSPSPKRHGLNTDYTRA